jgi:hypothetical protein
MWSGQVAASREPATLTASASEREDSQMHRIAQVRTRLDAARGMPEVLSASCQAFEQLLATIREHEERAGGLFAAFVMAAASAADGRDALIAAPSLLLPLPAARTRSAPGVSDTAGPVSDPAGLASIDDVADALADLSQLTAATLARAASDALDRSDQAACTEAARCAKAMWSLLARPGP